MPFGTEVGLVPGHIVLHGDPGHNPKKGTAPPPQFLAGLIKMPLGTVVDIGPGDSVSGNSRKTELPRGASTDVLTGVNHSIKSPHCPLAELMDEDM